MVYGPWRMMHGACSMAHGAWCMVHGALPQRRLCRGVNKCRCQGGHSGDHCQVGEEMEEKVIEKEKEKDTLAGSACVQRPTARHRQLHQIRVPEIQKVPQGTLRAHQQGG